MNILNKNLRYLTANIADSRTSILLKIYDDFKDLFHHAKGSGYNHQAWNGGYADHIAECLRINEVVYNSLSQMRPLGFSKASSAIVLFLHDIEKPFRYGPIDDQRCKKWQEKFANDHQAWEKAKWEILEELKNNYGFILTDEEINGLKYTHGEGSEHRKKERVSTPLAAHVHHCDNISARIWHNEGRNLG